MEPITLEGLPEDPLLLLDSAPIIYVLEGHRELAAVSRPVFKAPRSASYALCGDERRARGGAHRTLG